MALDEETEAFLAQMRERAATASGEPTLAQMRAGAAEMARTMGFPREEVGRVTELTTDGGVGIRLYVPADVSAPPLVVWAHGGNWTRLSVDDLDHHLRVIANRSRCAVAAVRISLAPEARLPVAIEELLDAAAWLRERGPQLGVDAGRIAIGGESSGANLAAAAARVDRDRGSLWFAQQALLLPVLDVRFDTDSWKRLGGGARVQLRWGRDQYAPGVADDDPLLSPGTAQDLAGLPPALIAVAELDPLRDEGIAYAHALSDAGVDAELVEYAGLIHPAILAAGLVGQGRRAVEETATRLGERLRAGTGDGRSKRADGLPSG